LNLINKDAVGAFYRLSFTGMDIYTNLIIDLISYCEEGSDAKVEEAYVLIGVDVAHKIGLDRLTATEFERWTSPNVFILKESTGKEIILFQVHIAGGGRFNIHRVKQSRLQKTLNSQKELLADKSEEKNKASKNYEKK
jgi:hypothetical protein